MKRNYLGSILPGLLLVALFLWFLSGRGPESAAVIVEQKSGADAAPAVPSPESPLAIPTPSVPGEIAVELEPVAGGLDHPTDLVFLPGKPDVAVLLEQPGRIVWLTPGQGPAKPWFSVNVDDTFTEKGLLGLAFHPRFLENGRLFLNYTVHEGKQDFSLITEWKARHPSHPFDEPAVLTREIMRLAQPFVNHDGGCLRFGPDGMLYIGWGDGGAGGDTLNEGQNGANWLGSMLRVDVDAREQEVDARRSVREPNLDAAKLADAGKGSTAYAIPVDNPFLGRKDVLPETFAIGLRNPWRFTFAPDGRLVVADVGQETWEEIGFAMPGDNLGWKIMEGRSCFKADHCDQQGLRLPFHVYGRADGGSVTGGEVVLAPGPLHNLYVFGDYLSGRLWALRLPDEANGTATSPVALGEWPIHPSTFGRDPQGRIYVADHPQGILYRIVPRP